MSHMPYLMDLVTCCYIGKYFGYLKNVQAFGGDTFETGSDEPKPFSKSELNDLVQQLRNWQVLRFTLKGKNYYFMVHNYTSLGTE